MESLHIATGLHSSRKPVKESKLVSPTMEPGLKSSIVKPSALKLVVPAKEPPLLVDLPQPTNTQLSTTKALITKILAGYPAGAIGKLLNILYESFKLNLESSCIINLFL